MYSGMVKATLGNVSMGIIVEIQTSKTKTLKKTHFLKTPFWKVTLMELFVAVLFALGLLTPDSAASMSDPALNQFVATQQPVIQNAMQDPALMQSANNLIPLAIDRLED